MAMVDVSSTAAARRRAAFTLLELLLASAIGVLLMGALYVAMRVQLRHAQVAREVVQESTLVRALFTKIESDINGGLGFNANTIAAITGVPLSGGGQGAAQGAGAGAAGGSAAGTSGTNNSGGGSNSGNTGQAAGTGSILFNLGVQGDSSHFIIYGNWVPRELNSYMNTDPNAPTPPVVADLRRIGYWLAGSGDAPLGLARQEVKLVTSDDALNSVPPDVPDEASNVIAEEVKSLSVSYFDGSTWQETWDSTQTGPDGVTPIGPPAAIAITLGVAAPGASHSVKNYKHVVILQTANGLYQLNHGGTNSTTTSNTGS
jgi:prepilin-type N-terminal cleavage/methylation domain-containing protein